MTRRTGPAKVTTPNLAGERRRLLLARVSGEYATRNRGIHEKHSRKFENNRLFYSTTMLSIELNYI